MTPQEKAEALVAKCVDPEKDRVRGTQFACMEHIWEMLEGEEERVHRVAKRCLTEAITAGRQALRDERDRIRRTLQLACYCGPHVDQCMYCRILPVLFNGGGGKG